MLPERLGAGTTVIIVGFQNLSGSPHREHPHRWLAEELQKARPALPKPPDSPAWGETLTWFQQAEAALGETRVLLALDEIERVQTGINEGWGSPAFLDFLRAAGDSLRRIRLLLVAANPLHRLGPAWTDRLISVVHREITYLLPVEAEDLIQNPMPGFPDIYPPGCVARIVRETTDNRISSSSSAMPWSATSTAKAPAPPPTPTSPAPSTAPSTAPTKPSSASSGETAPTRSARSSSASRRPRKARGPRSKTAPPSAPSSRKASSSATGRA